MDKNNKWRALAKVLGKHTGKPVPPKNWWDEHTQRITEEHPDYDEDKLNRAVGRIWFKIYSDERRQSALLAEAIKGS